MKYEFELFDLVCLKLTAPPKKRGGGIIYLASRFILSSLVNTVYRLLMLKVMNQVWYIIIFLHVLSAKYLTACPSLCSEGYLSTLDLKAKWEKKISYYASVCYQKPRTSWKDVKDRGTTEEGEIV